MDLDESFAVVTATASNNEAKFVSNPNRFYGRIGEDFEQWLREFERCARANHWSKDRCSEILPSLLRDRAADVWEEMPDAVQFDYDKTKEVLTEHFLPKEARRLYFSDLYGRQQGEQRWRQGRNAGGAKTVRVPTASEASKMFTGHTFQIGLKCDYTL